MRTLDGANSAVHSTELTAVMRNGRSQKEDLAAFQHVCASCNGSGSDHRLGILCYKEDEESPPAGLKKVARFNQDGGWRAVVENCSSIGCASGS